MQRFQALAGRARHDSQFLAKAQIFLIVHNSFEPGTFILGWPATVSLLSNVVGTDNCERSCVWPAVTHTNSKSADGDKKQFDESF